MRIPIIQDKRIAVFLIAGCAVSLVWLADGVGLLAPLNRSAHDLLFCIRAVIDPPESRAPVVMVEVDDETFDNRAFQKPMALWHDHFGTVITALADSGAIAVGLDYVLPGSLFDDTVPGYSQAWRRALILARSKGTPVVAAFIQLGERQVMPHKSYVFALGAENLGFANMTPDGDDVVRRQRLIIPATDGGEPLRSLGYLLFRAARPEGPPAPEDIYIDFLHRNHFFARKRFDDVHDKAVSGDIFSLRRDFGGKVVIIGTVDSLTHDRHLTPLRHLNMLESLIAPNDTSGVDNKRTPGPHIQASIVHTLYAGRFFREASRGVRFGVCLVLALIVSWMAAFLGFRRIIYGSTSLVLVFFSLSVFAFLNYLILPLSTGLAVIGVGLFFSFYYRYVVLDSEKRRMDHLFETFLTPQVAQGVLKLKDTDLFKGEKKRLCILFSDIRGFTTFSKEQDDLIVVERLNEYYGAMSEAIFQESGVVSRFFGDGLLAFFGAYDEAESPSLSGVRAALNMVKQLKILNHEWLVAGKERFAIGIGLHVGDVAFGGIGSTRKMEITLTGDTANLASRVESKTKELGESILVSEAVYIDVKDRLPATIRFEDKGVQNIKGRSPVRLYALKIDE